MVALGILAILLVIIVLPLRLGFDSFNSGNARSITQSSLDSTMSQFETDLRQAVYVFPNTRVPGITDQFPYTDDPAGTNNSPHDARLPYYLSTNPDDTKEPGMGTPGNPKGIACGNSKSWANPSRIDMIQVRRDGAGNVISPLTPSYNIVTYYARRQQLDKPYDPVDNPVVMYRAEYPAFGLVKVANVPNGTVTVTPAALAVSSPVGAFNARIDVLRIKRVTNPMGASLPTVAAECVVGDSATNRNSLWLSHNVYGEADLLPLTEVGKTNSPPEFTPAAGYDVLGSTYSHTLAIPRGLALEVSNGYRIAKNKFAPVAPANDSEPDAPLVPDTSFTTTDSNNDGKIDRVTISLGLASFQVGAQGELKDNQQPVGTRLRATRTVDLPNIR